MSDTVPPAPPVATAEEAESPKDAAKRRYELMAAILLGLAALATAWAAYQGGKAGGDELAAFTESNQALADANFFFSQGNSTLATDNQLFLAFVEAANGGNPELAEFIRATVINENLGAAMDWWAATEEALTPFDDLEGNPYQYVDYEEGAALQATAEEKLAEAQTVGQRGDAYDLASVLLAVSLFFGGISIIFDRPSTINVLLAVSAVTLVLGLARMLTV